MYFRLNREGPLFCAKFKITGKYQDLYTLSSKHGTVSGILQVTFRFETFSPRVLSEKLPPKLSQDLKIHLKMKKPRRRTQTLPLYVFQAFLVVMT